MINYLYSIRPQHVLNIARKDKTYEFRTKLPREMKEAIDKGEKVVMWIYCTKGKPYLYFNGSEYEVGYYDGHRIDGELNGLVVAKCVVDEYTEIGFDDDYGAFIRGNNLCYEEIIEKSCVTNVEFEEYFYGKGGFALHLTQVEMLDKPLQVGEFHSWNFNKWHEGRHWIPLTRAPQSYQKVKAPEGFHSCPTT